MKRLYSCLAFVLIPLVMLQPARALDLLEGYRLALDNDPEFQAAQAGNQAAQEAKAQARAGLLPNISLSAETRYNKERRSGVTTIFSPNDADFNSNSYQLNLTQPIYRQDRWIQLAQADASIRQANAELEGAHLDLMERITRQYFQVLRAEDELEFVSKTKEAISRQLNQAEQRFEVGLIAITDVEEAKAAFDQAVTNEIRARNELENAYEALREIIGEYHTAVNGVSQELELVRPDPDDIDAWTATALDQNLDLAAARYAAEVARDEIRRTSAAGHYPTVDLLAVRSFDSNRRIGDTNTRVDAIALQVAVPIYSGGLASSTVRQSQHRYQAAQDRVEQARRATQRQARDAFLGVTADISRINAFRQALRSTETALKATEAGFQVGTRTTVDVVNAQVDMFRARRDYKAARYDYIANTLLLKQAAGTLSEDDLAYFNQWLTE